MKKIRWPDICLFAKMTWPEIKEAAESGAIALVPVAQIEEHGPHLPVDTDVVIGETVTLRAAEILKKRGIPVVVLPTVWSGYSEIDVARFPGTISVRPIHLANLLTDIGMSLVRSGFKKIGFIISHGQNKMAVETAIRELRDQVKAQVAMFTFFSPEIDKKILSSKEVHGGEGETSIYLAVAPEYVDMEKAPKEPYVAKGRKASSALHSGLCWWTTWSVQRTKSGIFGDATLATKEKGEALIDAYANLLADMVEEYYRSPYVSPEEHGEG